MEKLANNFLQQLQEQQARQLAQALLPIALPQQTVVVQTKIKAHVTVHAVNGSPAQDVFAINYQNMGWSFRKSKSFGPFRLNLSRSGLGISFGVKGARISANNNGTFVTIGANGIYYRQRLSGKTSHTIDNHFTPEITTEYNQPHTITTNSVEAITDVESQAFVQELEEKAHKIEFLKALGIWPSFFVMLYLANYCFGRVEQSDFTRIEQYPSLALPLMITPILLTIICLNLRKLDKQRKTLELNYILDQEVKDLHEKFLKFFSDFALCGRVWQNLSTQQITDQKHNSGATRGIFRIAVRHIHRHRLPSSFLKTNILIPCIILKNTEMYFFPERLILKRGDKFGSVFYKNISIDSTNVRFIEEENLPADADVIGYTWKYLNKNGGPDRRFSVNPKIPICLYTEYNFKSDNGINEVITTSKTGGMDNFTKFLTALGKFQLTLN